MTVRFRDSLFQHNEDTDFTINHISGVSVRVEIEKVWKDKAYDNHYGYDYILRVNGHFIHRFEHGVTYDWQISRTLEGVMEILTNQ